MIRSDAIELQFGELEKAAGNPWDAEVERLKKQ